MSSVILVPYTHDWPRKFALVHAQLIAVFAGDSIQVEHIGSTSIPGLAAKPVIDVVLGADTLKAIEARATELESCGYTYIARYEQELPMRRYFTKPGTGSCARIHLHAVVLGSKIWRDHIAFRGALRVNNSLRAEYHSLKQDLAARFSQDKAAYTAAKAPFIRTVLDSLQPALGANHECAP